MRDISALVLLSIPFILGTMFQRWLIDRRPLEYGLRRIPDRGHPGVRGDAVVPTCGGSGVVPFRRPQPEREEQPADAEEEDDAPA